MLREHIIPLSEVIRAILLDDSPCGFTSTSNPSSRLPACFTSRRWKRRIYKHAQPISPPHFLVSFQCILKQPPPFPCVLLFFACFSAFSLPFESNGAPQQQPSPLLACLLTALHRSQQMPPFTEEVIPLRQYLMRHDRSMW